MAPVGSPCRSLGDDPGDQVQSELIFKLGHQALCDVDDVHDSSGSPHLTGTAMPTAPPGGLGCGQPRSCSVGNCGSWTGGGGHYDGCCGAAEAL